jgi:hypothetical protein
MTSAQLHEAQKRASECKPKQQGQIFIVLTKLTTPDGLNFADLALEREPVTRRLLFLPAPLGALCVVNGLDPEETLADEDLSCWLICERYLAHRLAGGEPDPVAEAILADVAELEATGIAVLLPGSAFPN